MLYTSENGTRQKIRSLYSTNLVPQAFVLHSVNPRGVFVGFKARDKIDPRT